MQFHILDENFTPVAIMDNDLPDAVHFSKSKFQRFLTGSADFLDFETSKLHTDSGLFQVGYWLAFKYNNRDNLLYITQIDEAERDKMMSISLISLNLDLNLEMTLPFSASSAQPFSWYFNQIMHDTGYEIGLNEISNLTRKLSWDSEMSHRAFLQSVATQFDNAELDYEVQLNSDFTIKKRLVHIKKKAGEVREDIELRYGENVRMIKRTTDISTICTAVRPTSKDDNDKVTTIASMANWQEVDVRGNVKFSHTKGENFIKAPQANARFGNRGGNVNSGGYIVYDFSHDKISQSELFNRAKAYLEAHSVPAINYEVEGRTGANIGDTVKIVDDGYTPQLILSARVLEQVVSFDDATVETATFGNYKALQSQISADLIAKMQQLAEENAPYKATTLTTNGLTFKNSEGITTLTARLYKGNKELTPESYQWMMDDIAMTGSGDQCEVTADDVDGKAVVRWSAVINGNVVAFDEVTIIDVSDGVAGTDGADGRGIASVTQKWLVQSSSAKPAYAWTDAKWLPSLPAMTATDKYLYTIERTIYTDETTSDVITLSAVYGDNGVKGDKGDTGATGSAGSKGDKGEPTGIIKSETEPANKFANMIWYVNSDYDVANDNMEVGTVAQSHGTYTWTGSKWSLYKLRSVNMEMDNGFIKEAMIEDAQIGNAKIKGTLSANKIDPSSGNMLINSDFSTSIDGWEQNGDITDKWYLSAGFYEKDGVRYREAGINAVNGEWTTSDWRRIRQTISVREGQPYSASLLGRVDNNVDGIGIVIEWLNTSGNLLSSVSSTILTTSTRTLLKIENVKAPAGATQMYFTIIARGKTNAYVTQVMLNVGTKVAPWTAATNNLTVLGNMIVKGSVEADKLDVEKLSAIVANLGDVTAGTYTSWSVESFDDVYNYLNGIYIAKGHIRVLTIENPSSTDVDTVGVAAGKAVRGIDVYAGKIDFYQATLVSTNSQTANNILKSTWGQNFWSQQNDVGGYCGTITSYKYQDGKSQITIQTNEVRVVGDLNVNGDDVSSKRSKTVTLNYGMTAEFRRRGNLVHVTFPRQVRTINATSEDGKANETIPVGYRPAARTEFNINRNTGSNVQASLLYSFLPSGEVRVTNSVAAAALYSGSTMYFTDDPMPS